MKNKLFMGLFVALIATVAGLSFKQEKSEIVQYDKYTESGAIVEESGFKVQDNQRLAVGETYTKTVTNGAIAGTEADTISVSNLVSNYQLSIETQKANVSGTTNIAVYLDASNATSGTDNWVAIDTLPGTGTGLAKDTYDRAYYLRYRIRLKGTGTQSSTYKVWLMAKKTN